MRPDQLKALVDQSSQAPDIAPLVGMSADGDGDDADEDMDEPQEDTADPLTRGNELISSWGEQGEALKESAGEIVDGAHEVGGNLLLGTVPEETTDAVEEAYEGMPEDIQVLLAQHIAELPAGDVTALATALVDDNDGETEVPDVKLVATYLKAVAALAKEDVDPDDFVQDEEEDEDEGDDDDGDGDGEQPPTAPVASGGTSSAPVASPTKPLS